MKIQELQKLNKEELFENLEERRKSLHEMRINLASEKVKNIKELKEAKKDIARILTIINTK
ncbi:MAG: 50S ribosomal protein L29 [Candidatus Pacebacteria bacterium]|nr:50S ribosomal protein L29 [Candidatus Paceibacterota bacterium]